MAKTDYIEPTPEQLKIALSEICTISLAIRSICANALQGDEDGSLMVAAEGMASQIGLIADRCLGFDINGGIDAWLLPPSFEAKKEASHEPA